MVGAGIGIILTRLPVEDRTSKRADMADLQDPWILAFFQWKLFLHVE